MPLQGIWSGTISFSLVAIPVRLVPALAPGRISFHLLHDKEYAPLSRKMKCSLEETIVPREEIVRGYEIEPDTYVVVTDEELESVTPERSRTIEIIEFIDLNEVDPIYYDHPYYLVPMKGGEKAYRLLAEVMRRTNRAGLAKFVLSEREHLVALTVRDGALALNTLHYADEIVSDQHFAPKQVADGRKENNDMLHTIERMMARFDPAKHGAVRRKQLEDLLAKIAEERPPVESPAPQNETGEAPPDLASALEESMRAIKEKQ